MESYYLNGIKSTSNSNLELNLMKIRTYTQSPKKKRKKKKEQALLGKDTYERFMQFWGNTIEINE